MSCWGDAESERGARTHDARTAIVGALALALLGLPWLGTACGGDGGGDPAPEAAVYTIPFGATNDGGPPADLRSDAGADGGDATADTGGPDLAEELGVDLAVDLPDPTTVDGEACDRDGICFSRSCLSPEEGFPEGMCSPDPCSVDVPCTGSDTVCYAPPGDGAAFCTRRCQGSTDCRTGYSCDFIAGAGFGACTPQPERTDRPDGEDCTSDEQCAGGTCLLPPQYPGGYCTTLSCETFADCASGGGEDNRCLIAQAGGANQCVRICETSADCRSRYVCQPLDDEVGYCAPDPNRPIEVDPDVSPLPFDCDVDSINFTTKRSSFSIAEATTSYMAVPVALDGRRLQPSRIVLPGGEGRIDFRSGRNARQSGTAQILGFTGPVVVPWVEETASQLAAGNHDFDVETSSSSLCTYVLEESQPDATAEELITLNLYLVGLPGVRAEIADGDLNLRQMVREMNTILEQANVRIDEVRYFDADADATERYRIIRSDADIYGLVATSAPPGPTLEEHLSFNLFLVQDFQMQGGAIGVSSGIPGPAGLHGTSGSGVVATGASLGNSVGNAFTAQVATHEMGHYLGLWHTSELNGVQWDPVSDTEECQNTRQLESCPDIDNLMFPIAGQSHVDLSDGQAFMLRMNPLTRPTTPTTE